MADRKISEFTVVTDLAAGDYVAVLDSDAAAADKNAIITPGNFKTNVLGISAFGATLIDDADAATARTTLSLGGAAVLNVGTGAGTVAAGDDSRLSDARTPTAHASTHASGQADAIKLDDLAAPDDNTDLDATTSAHGLLPKLGGGTSNYLRADGTWAQPPDTDTVYDGDIADIDLDGGTDIGADLADADLILVDDGASGTNRKSALSRVWTYISGKLAAFNLTGFTSGAATDGQVPTADGAGNIAWEDPTGGGTFDGDLAGNALTDTTSGTVSFSSTEADGATAVGFDFVATNDFATTGSKIASFKDNTSDEHIYLDNYKSVISKTSQYGGFYFDAPGYGSRTGMGYFSSGVYLGPAVSPAMYVKGRLGAAVTVNGGGLGFLLTGWAGNPIALIAAIETAKIGIGNNSGLSPHSLVVCNTFTNSSNYEGAGIYWNANVCEIKTEAVGTGVQRPLVLDASAITANKPIIGVEQSSDPADPPEGRHVIWQSDGTGTGDDGDILIKITAGGTTKTVTLVDFSAA